MFELTDHPIDLPKLAHSLQQSKAGALVTFEGWVRDHNQGKAVSSLEYQVYESLALKEGNRVVAEAKEKFNLHAITAVHRHGHLKIGEVAVWIGASASHRDDAFQATRYVIDEIKNRLPIWKKEHYLNEKAEWVFCKDHATHVHFSENEYYQKQNSVVNQPILKSKKVLVVGAGGLGCPVLTALTTAGVGKIAVLDFDRVELTNLHRQPLFAPADIGESKARIAEIKLSEMNRFVKIESIAERLDAKNVNPLIRDYDLIMDCTDNLETKFILHDACYSLGIPLIAASIYRFEGQIRSFLPGSDYGCLRCTLPHAPKDEAIGNCNDFGVLGASVSAIGAMQAGEAVQFLSRGKNASSESTVYFDLNSLSVMKIKNLKKNNCVCCSNASPQHSGASEITFEPLEITIEELNAKANEEFELIDIRNEEDSFLDQFAKSSKKIVVYCHRGIRSKRVVTQYRERGFQNLYSLAGGACSL